MAYAADPATEQHRRVPLRSLLRPDTDRDPRRRRLRAIQRKVSLLYGGGGRSSSARVSLERSRLSMAAARLGAVARSERQGFLARKRLEGWALESESRVLERVWMWKGFQEWSWKVQDSSAWRVFMVLWVMVSGNSAFPRERIQNPRNSCRAVSGEEAKRGTSNGGF